MTAVLASALDRDFFCFFQPRLPSSTPTVSKLMPAEFGRLLTPCVALSRGGVESSCVTVTLRLPVRPHPFAHHEGSSLGEPIKSSWMSSKCLTWLLDVFFSMTRFQGIQRKSDFFEKHSVPEDFQQEQFLGLVPTESLRTQNSKI